MNPISAAIKTYNEMEGTQRKAAAIFVFMNPGVWCIAFYKWIRILLKKK